PGGRRDLSAPPSRRLSCACRCGYGAAAMATARGRLSVEAYAAGVHAGDRAVLARAITLVESQRDDDQALARALIAALQPKAGGALRVGITGSPGVGKSTL